MNKIQTIIFSYDRAMQLSYLIESYIRQQTTILDLFIIYSYSSPEYKEAYDIIIEKYPNINWNKETRFHQKTYNKPWNFSYIWNYYWWIKYPFLRTKKSNFRDILLNILKQREYPFVMFLTDDSFFLRNIDIVEQSLQEIRQLPQKTSYSLRHGANLRGGIYDQNSQIIHFNVYENDIKTDWGYPFSVDGHIYDRETINRISRKVLFNNPNTYESNIMTFVHRKKLFQTIISNKESMLIGFELNRVQDIYANNNIGISQQELNSYFKKGYSLFIEFDPVVDSFRPHVQKVFVLRDEKKILIYPTEK